MNKIIVNFNGVSIEGVESPKQAANLVRMLNTAVGRKNILTDNVKKEQKRVPSRANTNAVWTEEEMNRMKQYIKDGVRFSEIGTEKYPFPRHTLNATQFRYARVKRGEYGVLA